MTVRPKRRWTTWSCSIARAGCRKWCMWIQTRATYFLGYRNSWKGTYIDGAPTKTFTRHWTSSSRKKLIKHWLSNSVRARVEYASWAKQAGVAILAG